MPETLPAWFAADRIFAAPDGWYVGAEDGFRVGPFPQQAQAERHSRELTAKLKHCRNTTEMVRAVRWFIHDQVHRHGRVVRGGQEKPRTQEDGPRSRAGESTSARVRFRTDRVFAVGGEWFFATRENVDVGPYPSKGEAELDAARLLNTLRHTPPGEASQRAILEFKARRDGAGD